MHRNTTIPITTAKISPKVNASVTSIFGFMHVCLFVCLFFLGVCLSVCWCVCLFVGFLLWIPKDQLFFIKDPSTSWHSKWKYIIRIFEQQYTREFWAFCIILNFVYFFDVLQPSYSSHHITPHLNTSHHKLWYMKKMKV